MNSIRRYVLLVLLLALTCSSALGREKNLADNAALRYWAAFAQMQDSSINDEEAKKLTSVLEGAEPYHDLEFMDLVEKNKPALDLMARATKMPYCDWGLDYELGPDTPVEYVRKALVLGRLNVLYAFHLLVVGDKSNAISVQAAGLRFSRDVANGGTIFATLVAKTLLVAHLRSIAFGLQMGGLSVAQKAALQLAVAQLGSDGLEWQSAVKREMDVLYRIDPQDSASLKVLVPLYLNVMSNPSALPSFEQMRSSAPPPLAELIPNPRRVLEAKQDLTDRLREMRSKLQ